MVPYILLAVSLFFIVFAVLVFVVNARQRAAVSKRIGEIEADEPEEGSDQPARAERFVTGAAGFASAVRSSFGARLDDATRIRMESAGIRIPRAADIYFVARWGLPILAAAAAYFAFGRILVAMSAAVAAWMLPEFILDQMIKRYRLRIHRAMPDVVDLLSVCVEAGLGLDQALLRTAREMRLAYPEVCYELMETNRERQAGLTRVEAWKNLVERTHSEDIDMMMTMFQQADELGTPMTTALRSFSDSLRSTRCNLAREKAKRTGVLILGPLALFIFPTMFAVLLGPVVLQALHDFSHLAFKAHIP